jgi:hypothetical protein
MRRQGCTPGCAVTVLGALISCFLLPYLASSIYAIARAVLDVPGTPEWLWGEWVGTWVRENQSLYMVLTEGPICCAGVLGLMAVIFGVVFALSDLEGAPEGDEGLAEYQELPWEQEFPWDEEDLEEHLPWDEEDEWDEEGEWDEEDEEEAYESELDLNDWEE